jgi:hypothetical protein
MEIALKTRRASCLVLAFVQFLQMVDDYLVHLLGYTTLNWLCDLGNRALRVELAIGRRGRGGGVCSRRG